MFKLKRKVSNYFRYMNDTSRLPPITSRRVPRWQSHRGALREIFTILLAKLMLKDIFTQTIIG